MFSFGTGWRYSGQAGRVNLIEHRWSVVSDSEEECLSHSDSVRIKA